MSGRSAEKGQSLTEFAIFVPILLFILLGIADLARIYSTIITIESAAREAADWGANGGQGYTPIAAIAKWAPDPVTLPATVQGVNQRACTPAMTLPEYAGASDGSSCTNPAVECTIGGSDCSSPPLSCVDPSNLPGTPCQIVVRLTYSFDVIAPGGLLGLPATVTFVRDSTFNLADPD